MKSKLGILALVVILLAGAIWLDNRKPAASAPTPTLPPPAASEATATSPVESLAPQAIGSSAVVFSEVLAGVQGNNNLEFIELYNGSQATVDLLGWSVWYRLNDSGEEVLLYRWRETTWMPPYGHYLLARSRQDLGMLANGVFEQALNTVSGGLQLRQMDGTVRDSLGWGTAPAGYFEGTPAPSMTNGISLERLPGGTAGNAVDTEQNATDFHLNNLFAAQNSGSPITPALDRSLFVSLQAPESVQPGTQYDYTMQITNQCGQAVQDARYVMLLPEGLNVQGLADDLTQDSEQITWAVPALPAGESSSVTFTANVPWTYFTASASNYYAQASGCPLPAFGNPVFTRIEGGVIPIGTARTLLGADLTIEGRVSMYTGGYFAGSGNNKFYLQDETGGLQVQVFGGQNTVHAGIGELIQVRGNVSAYRGSLQIVPLLVPDDVIHTDQPRLAPEPMPVSIQQAATDNLTLPGWLLQVEGTVTRVEEFTYNYELDLMDTEGQLLTLYVDKQTNINVETIEVGQQYRAVGILEVRDTSQMLYPRLQEDLQQIFPPELLLDVEAPNLMAANGLITYTLTAFNHTAEPLTNVTLTAALPDGTSLAQIVDNGSLDGSTVTWIIPELAGGGASSAVSFSVLVSQPAPDIVILQDTSATAAEWTIPVLGTAMRTFSGGSVPIWAIQGDSFRSPYVFDQLTTSGIVTGIFPGLGGFYIQSLENDEDPATSEGLFVSTGQLEIPVQPDQTVQVTGLVRELNGQTAVQVTDASQITVLSEGTRLPAIELDPPDTLSEAGVYYESLEGSLVSVSQSAIAVSPTTKYGEYVLVLADRNISRLFQGEDNGFAIMVDDGVSTVHTDNSTLSYTVTTGDSVSDLVGPLAYTYGRYKIEPIQIPSITPGGRQPNVIQPTAAGEFSIMSWNVENLFDVLDPNPADPPRPSLAQYRQDLARVAATIRLAGAPTVVALQEIENLGILEDLAEHELLSEFQYQPYLIEGFDSRGIDVGYLVRLDQADVVDIQQRSAPEGLTSRPPLLLQLEVQSASGPLTIYVINNHFTSMSGGVEATQPRRTAQAAWNLTLVQEIQAENPDAWVAVVGDLNSFFDSLPIQALREGGMQHVLDQLTPEERYTYIFEGDSQVLDHILVTSSLFDRLVRVEIFHTNADFPPQAPGDLSTLHQSDHDPVVATFAP